jgi:isoleucyl-tRNA synthetase
MLFLCVSVQVRDPAKGTVYLVAEARLAALPGAVPKPKKGGGADKKTKDGKAGDPAAAAAAGGGGGGGFEVLAKFTGAELVGVESAMSQP